MRIALVFVASFGVLSVAGSAFADEATSPAPAAPSEPTAAPPAVEAPAAPATPAAPVAEAPAAAAAETPAPPSESLRSRGLRLSADLSLARATGSAAGSITSGSPGLFPVGADLSIRTSAKILLGVHGTAGLATRDDCIGDIHCTGRDYTVGGHFEGLLSSGPTMMPWIRYGMGFELLYQGGLGNDRGSHLFRDAFDFLDARFGVDFVVARNAEGKTTRIGPFVGMIGGYSVGQSGGTSNSFGKEASLDQGQNNTHVWLFLGARATFDP
jgi:hypothetical protein